MANLGHGGNAKELSRSMGIDYNDIIDFSANINPLGMPKSAKEAIIENLDAVEKYPDITYFELKNSIRDFENSKIYSEKLKIHSEEIILGNGAAEVLFNIVKAVEPKEALILAPTFSEYEEAVKAVNGKVDLYYLEEKNEFAIQEDILDYINEKLDLIFICNPNNPTGVITDKAILKKVLDKGLENNVYVVIDESFLDFIKEDFSMISFVENYKNLIIIKSLTKFFAIPGIRVGYGISSNKILLEKVSNITPAWNINILAEEAVKSALKDNKYIEDSIEFMNKEKDYLYKKMKEIDSIKVFKPSVNFILFKLHLEKDLANINIKDKLLEKNILVRSCSNYHGLDDLYYRIAVKKHEDNKILVNSLKEIL